MSLNVKHNKIKNTAILYELLSRQITADVINDSNSPKSVKIFKEFFNKNTELGKEYALYQVLLEKKYRNYSSEYWEKREMAPSSLLFYVGTDIKLENIHHHNLFLEIFKRFISKKTRMSDK